MMTRIASISLALLWVFSSVTFTGCTGHKKLKNEDKIELYYEAGVGYIHQGRPDQAINSFKHAYELNKGYPQVLQGLGLAYYQLGVPDTALIWFKRTEEITPDDPELSNNLASVYLSLKRYDESVVYSTKAINNPDYRTPAAAYFNRGIARLRLNDLSGAEEDFILAIRHEPLYAMPRIELSRIMIEKGNYDKAVTYATSVLKINRNDPEALLLRGQANWERGYVTKAETDFNLIIRLENVPAEIVAKAHSWLDRLQ